MLTQARESRPDRRQTKGSSSQCSSYLLMTKDTFLATIRLQIKLITIIKLFKSRLPTTLHITTVQVFFVYTVYTPVN